MRTNRGMRLSWRLAVLLCALSRITTAVSAENLARSAAYSVVISGFAYRGQVIPGTNTPAIVDGFVDAPSWQGPAGTLTDDRRDGDAVTSWFWSNMDKRITVRFDLRRLARIASVAVWPRTGANTDFDSVVVRIASTVDTLIKATQLICAKQEGDWVWRGGPTEGRFVEVVCSSGAPQMTLSELAIEGESLGPFVTDAPNPGLQPIPKRDLAALVKLPDKPQGVTNVAARADTQVTLASQHYDDKSGAWEDDQVAAQSGGGRTLIDGDPQTAARSYAGWYCAKTVTAQLDLGKPWHIERVVVWSAGHSGSERSYLNSFNLWLQAGPGGAWVPAGEVRNPVLPGEIPAAVYPVISPVLGREARSLRLQFNGVAQSADVLQAGEVEVWARPTKDEVTATPWRVKVVVPPIMPVRMARVSPALDWIRKERVRALYGYVGQWKDEKLLGEIRAAGFNAMIVHTMSTAHKEDGWPEEAQQWARIQKQRKLHIIISWPFGSDERYGNTEFGAYQPGGMARWTRTPCPLSQQYWDKVVGDRAAIAAHVGLTGMVVDMEMYGADSTRYAGPCCCDKCFGRFVHEHLEGVEAGDISMVDRPAWMAGNGLSEDYARWQESEVTAILRGIEQRVHAINPAFLLGNLLDPESLPGLARGFGTPNMPALIFSELEYHGNIAGPPSRLSQLRDEGYPALYVPGFWIQPVTPPQLPPLVEEAGPASAGYWIWSTAAFAENAKGEYAHAKDYTHDDYWRAFRVANDILSDALARKPTSRARTIGLEALPVPMLTVPRVPNMPQTDADWESAGVIESFVDYAVGAPAKAATNARAVWDGKRLYLRIACAEPTPEKSPPLQGGRDDANLWQQDSIEVFWMRPGSARYAHVIVSAAGTICDAMAEGLRTENPGWNADIKAVTRRREHEWELDLSIPLDADARGAIRSGDRLRFELARNRPGGGETTCWAPTRGMFRAAPNLWGILTLR